MKFLSRARPTRDAIIPASGLKKDLWEKLIVVCLYRTEA